MTPKEYEQFQVDSLNDTQGNENERDGYDCQKCKNRGWIAKLVDKGNGEYGYCVGECECAPIRKSIMRMKRSGLEDVIKKCTFARFEETEEWQKVVKHAAMEYAKNPVGWFFVGGQSGCGKTHLCTAICRELLLRGMETHYMKWRDDIAKLKGLSLDAEEREAMISKYKNAKVLYIDDLFKTGRNPDGTEPKPTAADINIAFEIINYRYCKPDLLTIISSELSINELVDIDEATGGRICERAKVTNISKDRSRNYRTKNAMTI
jgi:DNA replication protein DnaC